MVANENLELSARLEANMEISTLRFTVESAIADAVVASSKNSQLCNQLKGSHVECVSLMEQLREMRELLEELRQRKG